MSQQLPEGIEALLGDGDGTVPYLSAIPIELSNEYRNSFIAEKHSSLQNNSLVLNDLRNRLKQMQVQGLGAIRGPEISKQAAERAAISLDLDDLYLTGEPVLLRAKLVNMSVSPKALKARIEPVTGVGAPVQAEFRESAEEWVLAVDDLTPGLYRVEVRTREAGPQAPTPVHDLFEVASIDR